MVQKGERVLQKTESEIKKCKMHERGPCSYRRGKGRWRVVKGGNRGNNRGEGSILKTGIDNRGRGWRGRGWLYDDSGPGKCGGRHMNDSGWVGNHVGHMESGRGWRARKGRMRRGRWRRGYQSLGENRRGIFSRTEKRCHKRRKYRMQSVKYFAPVIRVTLVYPSNFFRKPILPVRVAKVVLVIGSFFQKNRKGFLEKCNILGREVAWWIMWEYADNKGFKVHLLPNGNTGFEYRIW